MKKVLLIAFYFNQKNEIASKRLRGLAKYLPNYGWEPIIITPNIGKTDNNSEIFSNSNLNFEIIETEYEDMLDKWISKFDFILNSREDIDVGVDANTDIGTNTNRDIDINSNVNNTGVDYFSHSNKRNYLSKFISLAGELFAYPDGMKYWYKPAMEASKEIIGDENKNIKAIISSSWPITSHIIAKDLKKEYKDHNLSWIADLRDLWNMNPYIKHTFIRNYFEKKLEQKTFKYADVLTTTTELSAKVLKSLHPKKIVFPILSGFDPDEELSVENSVENLHHLKKLNFVYTGSLYGEKRDPSLLFEALNQLQAENKIDISKIAIDFYGDSKNLEKIVNEYKINDIINIHGQIPHEQAIEKQKAAQVLLILSWNHYNEKIFLPGKIYEYLPIKRPILSIGYKEGSLKELIEETNVGYHSSNLNKTKIAIMEFYDEFTKKGYVFYKGNKEINKYSQLTMAKNFSKLLNSLYNKKYIDVN